MPGGLFRCALIILLCLCLLFSPHSAFAQTETGYDLIARVNELRASHGLEPYTIDSWIMDYAQQHAQYQADIKKSTHEHSDGTVSLSVGLRENVASGDFGYVTTDIVVNQIWMDWGHLNVMIGFESGAAGAGVAVDNDGTVYYTLNVCPGAEVGKDGPIALVTASPSPVQNLPTAPFIPIITSTPAENGDIIHVVKFGATLWRIAVSYDVTVDIIRNLNGLGSDQVTIYERQRLLIRQAQATSTATLPEPSATNTSTPPLPTETPSPTPADLPVLQPTKAVTEQPAEQTGRNMFALGVGVGALMTGTVIGLLSLLKKLK